MTKLRKSALGIISLLSAGCFAASTVVYAFNGKQKVEDAAAQSEIGQIDGGIETHPEQYFDDSVVYRLPENVAEDEEISVIVAMDVDSVTDVYNQSPFRGSYQSFVASEAAKNATAKIERERNSLIKSLKKSGIDYTLGEKYDTLLSGFEITISASDFDKVNEMFEVEGQSSVIVGERYYEEETQVVTNEVDVYTTGIFDSSQCKYQGDGVVVAVLDTGCDYTHTAFAEQPEVETEGFDKASISAKVRATGDSKLSAAESTPGLTGDDVYISKKIPYAYDYADKDSDVAPINNEHGTHVAGIIAGHDSEITGVAPNAQLAIMKVFSDAQDGAKTSWILAALEDCVRLGVDIINMSLGSSCGFSREIDEVRKNEIYDEIKAQGISLIAAASNDYNSTFGSTKNGNLGLTSNPDSGTVGSPATYAASLSVASVDGVKTPYLKYEDDIIYFTEATTSSVTKKNFVDDVLNSLKKNTGTETDSYDFQYVTIPGIGRSSDYLETGDFYKDKIVLVKRGTTTFEDKVRVALIEKGAAGIIIYNNVSGSISMSVGQDMGAVCSITQDEGEKLAAAGTGVLHISREQTAGPFMSDFSSWGPTSDLKIKPEITAHGGEIYSCVPGQRYDRLSGTSMAAPNQAGATALIRQYVKDESGIFGDLTNTQITERVNQLMMSTADIVYNKNGLAYSVRKQGAGLMNIMSAINTASYITTYEEKDGETVEMDKSKLELGDDKDKSGVYEMTFGVTNISAASVSYDIDALVMTEGVSTTYTSHGETTVTEDGYMLDGAKFEILNISGGSADGARITVGAGQTAKISVKITLSESDKQYLDSSFENGMYVEGFITFKAQSGTDVDMSVPMLAFYGDWTEAPIFDEEYYDTNKDEINAELDEADKLMEDAYATRVIGGLYTDYIGILGSYYFVQDPSSTQIAADKNKIAISNKEGETAATLNRVRDVYAGLLRNCRDVDISITEDATGRVVYQHTEHNRMKSYSRGGSIMPSSIEVEFSALEHDLKNNTKYTVTLEAYIDYGEKGEQKNKRNVFTFPLYIDFEAPIVTDVEYRTEYDRTTKKTKLFADVSIYDNHYAMGMFVGRAAASSDPKYKVALETFGKYSTPIFSSFNSTSKVTVELTDYISLIREGWAVKNNADGTQDVVHNSNAFIINVFDYAMNAATYQIYLPDEFSAMSFMQNGEKAEEIKLNPNETLDLSTVLSVYPSDSWVETLDFTSDNPDVADVVNGTVIAKSTTGGEAIITATGHDKDGNSVSASVKIIVLKEGDEGYVGNYSVPQVNKFSLTSYHTNKAYYGLSSEDREIGLSGSDNDFGGNFNLSMFPSESVTVKYNLDSYFVDNTSVTFTAGNSRVATVDSSGTIVAQAEGTTIVTVSVRYNGSPTLYSERINITVKDPFETNSIYLNSYKGLGGEVIIPDDRGITTIYSYAFSNYQYVDKDLNAGDVINDEDPYYLKQMYIGDNTITKIVIPEGVKDIQSYAFANLTALEEVVLPSTLTRIGVGAFIHCSKLRTINLGNVQFINSDAFRYCALEEVDLSEAVAIGNYTFADNRLRTLNLSSKSQSLGEGAFRNNSALRTVSIGASKIKIAPYVFANCTSLASININTAVLSAHAFENCRNLTGVTLGKDVAVIGEYAFSGTGVASFNISDENPVFRTENAGEDIYEGTTLVLKAPAARSASGSVTITAKEIADGAFAGNMSLMTVNAPNARVVGDYAFAQCENLYSVTMPNLEKIGVRAFYDTKIEATPNLSNVTEIGDYAFSLTDVRSVNIADGTKVGEGAFWNCDRLGEVVIGDNVEIGTGAFSNPLTNYSYEYTGNANNILNKSYYTPDTKTIKDETGNHSKTYTFYYYNLDVGAVSNMTSVTIGENAVIGSNAFANNVKLTSLTLGDGAKIGEAAFYNDYKLTSANLSGAKEVGDLAFSGLATYVFYETTSYRGARVFARAMNFFFEGDVMYASEYVNSYFAPRITEADLTSAIKLGAGAFAYNDKLATVKLGSGVSKIDSMTFALNKSLSDLQLAAGITYIGPQAFYSTSITSIDLSGVEEIGNYAFENSALTSITLKEGASIGDYAFSYNENLAEVTNLDKATYIGGYAFSHTALTEVDLSAAEYIGEFAFAQSKLTKVKLGSALKQIGGSNPFYGCEIESFAKTEDIKFNGENIGEEEVGDYSISDNVSVIGGVLYQKLPNGGLELVCYPVANAAENYVVADGTRRISACAFAQCENLKSVTIAYTVKSIGDKAFYGCKKLAVVVFTSYNAPILEEKFDQSYANSSASIPVSGYYAGFEGLGISKYYMWTLSSSNNYYYGANFVDYVGNISDNIVVVRPVNGQNYDTFIMSLYFNTKLDGASAANDDTLYVIALIAALPDNITLADEQAVVAARAAYDSRVTSNEQKALVYNYSRLTNAESTIAFLKSQSGGGDLPPEQPTDNGGNNNIVMYIGYIIAGVALAALVGFVVATIIINKKKQKAAGGSSEETLAEAESEEAIAEEIPTEVAEAEEAVAEDKAEEAIIAAEAEEVKADKKVKKGKKTKKDKAVQEEETSQKGGDSTDENE